MLQNPFFRLRKEAGLTIQAWSAVIGVSSSTIQHLEAGSLKTPKTVLSALDALGYDPKALATEYNDWRQSLQQEAREKLAIKGGGKCNG